VREGLLRSSLGRICWLRAWLLGLLLMAIRTPFLLRVLFRLGR